MDASDDDYEATEDDVLDLAMRVATGVKQSLPLDEGTVSEDDDDEEVLWRPMAGTIGDRRYVFVSLPRICILTSWLPDLLAVMLKFRKYLSSKTGGFQPALAPNSRTASDLLLQVLQGSAMDMNNDASLAASSFFGEDGTLSSTGGFAGVPDGNMTTRSIWSSGSGNLPPPTSQVKAQPRPPSVTRLAAQSASAEALFNSMPNQVQNAGSNRSSPKMAGSAAFDPLKRNVFNPEAPAAPLNAQQDIWNPPSLRGLPLHDARAHHGAIRAPYPQSTRQFG